MISPFHRKKKVRRLKVTVPEVLGLAVGLHSIVAIVPWVPRDVRVPLSNIIHGTLEKLKHKRKNKEDLLLTELEAANMPLKETLEQAQNAINQFKENQWQIKGKGGKGVAIADIVGETASKINQYSAILGPATQVSPFFPAVVWGVFSTFLKIAMDDAEMGSKLIYFINTYMEVSEIYATYWRLHQHSRGRSSQKVRDLIGQVEEEIRGFVYAARKYYFNSKSTAGRIFRSANSPFAAQFQPICDGIRGLTDYLKLAVDAADKEEQKRHEILNWISKLPYQDSHINRSRKREKNTCGWLRKKDQFLSWMNSPSSRALWVHGNAGFGKTILMSSMVDYLQETLPNGNLRCKHVSYFYCVHDAKETLDTLVILRSILKQMVASYPDIPDKVISTFEHYKYLGKSGGLHLEAIMELLIETMQQASSPLFILIDGLDECDEVIRAELLETLMQLTLAVPSKQVKICVFSRPYDDIRRGLENPLEVPILKADNLDDMLTFLNGQIISSGPLEAILKQEQGLRDQVIRDLVNKADGMFLWVSLQQMNLRRERDPNSIKHYLQDLPNSENMEESYVRIINLIEKESPGNRKLAGTVLLWTLCAIRPLSVKELTDALYFLQLSKRAMEDLKGDIVHVCHGLVQIDIHNHVEYFRFIHFSVHQYVCNYFEQQFNPSRRTSTWLNGVIPSTDGDDAQRSDFNMSFHHAISQACIKYMLQSGLEKELLLADEVYNCRQEFDLLAAEHPFFLYASQAWMKHFQAAGHCADLTKICLELFRATQNLQLSFQIFWFQEFIENFPRGSTPLHIASYLGLASIISPLLEDMSGPFITDNQSRTPIYWAAYHGNNASLKALGLVQGCDRQVLGEALLAAVEGDQVKLIADLLSWGADPDVYVRAEKSALFYATLKGDSNLPVVQQLIKAGAKLEPEAPIAPILQAAAMAGALEITHYLLSLNVDVNVRSHDPPGLPLKTAVFSGQYEITELLLKSGADIRVAGLIEMTSMMGDPKMIDIILQYSASHLESSCIAECEEAESREGSSPHTSSQHKLPASTEVEISDPGLTNQSDKVSASQIPGIRIALRQALRLAKMGNMGQEIVSMVFTQSGRMLEKKFDILDFGFIEACESIAVEVGDEVLRAKPTTLFMQTAMRTIGGVLIYITPKIQTREQIEYNERLLQMIANLIVRLGDDGYEGNLREARMNIEKSLLEAIKTQPLRVDQLFAEVEAGMQQSVVMERYPLILRGNVKTYLTGIMAIIPPEEGIGRFAKFLDGVGVNGLSIKSDRPGNWRAVVVFIEIANCAYAYGHKRLYPQIQLKVALLRKAVRDTPRLNPDGIIMDQLGIVMAGGSPDWQWDEDEACWWNYGGK